MLFALEPAAADWYTVWGFGLSLAGVAVSAVGLAATYWQVRLARRSADAARDAAEATLRESRESFRRYLAAVVHRQLAEVEGFVADSKWALAALRSEDLAAIFAQLAESRVAVDFRKSALLLRDKALNEARKFPVKPWKELVMAAKRLTDELTAPFPIGGPSRDAD